MCGCECCIYAKSMHSYLLTWYDCRMKQPKDISHNSQNRSYGEIPSRIFETYKNAVRPHGCHIYNTSVDMAMVTMCHCTYAHHGIPHWKFVLRCCDKCTSILLPSQEANKDTTIFFPKIRFHVYRNISRFNVHDQHPYHKQKPCSFYCPSEDTSLQPITQIFSIMPHLKVTMMTLMKSSTRWSITSIKGWTCPKRCSALRMPLPIRVHLHRHRHLPCQIKTMIWLRCT